MYRFRKILVVCFVGFIFLLLAPAVSFSWTNCPPSSLPSNPQPVFGSTSCIASADWAELNLNELWSRTVQLEGGKSYWFSASKCARAYTIAGEVRDDQGVLVKSGSGSEVAFCFKAPKTGTYTVSYRVTELRGSYSFAITNFCLSESNCAQ